MSRETGLALGLARIDGWGGAHADVRVVEEAPSYILDASTLGEMADQRARYRACGSVPPWRLGDSHIRMRALKTLSPFVSSTSTLTGRS